jgi:adenosine kinase
MSTKKICGFGNPLLDISCHVDQATLDDWGAQLNNAILAEEKHQPKYAELAKREGVEFIAGGATLNSIRVAQWVLSAGTAGANASTAFIGCIGKDEFGETMESQLKADGVTSLFQKVDGTATGTCAVLVKDAERSLIANLAAAEKFDFEHFNSEAVQAVVTGTDIFYMAGFPLTHEGGGKTVAAICALAGKTVCMNLSAPFIVQVPPFRAALLENLKSCSYVFCNESEAAALSGAMEWGCDEKDIPAIAKKIAALGANLTAVVTQGADATVICKGETLSTYEVKGNPWTLGKADLKDTNGAGDAFVGGFLAGLATSKDEAACVKSGHAAAGTIIQQSGCTCPAWDTVAAKFA